MMMCIRNSFPQSGRGYFYSSFGSAHENYHAPGDVPIYLAGQPIINLAS